MISVQTKVAEQITKIAPAVEDAVVKTLVSREENRRAQAAVEAIDKLARLENDMKKLKPDLVTYDETGKEVSSSYSKARIDERTKLAKRIEKLTAALNKAFEKGDYSDVFNLAKGGDNDNAGSNSETN